MCSGASVWPQLRQDKHFILLSIVIQHVNTQVWWWCCLNSEPASMSASITADGPSFPGSTAPTVSAPCRWSGGRGDQIIKVTSLDPAQPSPAQPGQGTVRRFNSNVTQSYNLWSGRSRHGVVTLPLADTGLYSWWCCEWAPWQNWQGGNNPVLAHF